MKRNSNIAFPWLGSLTVSGILIFSHNQVLAQVTPDNTLGDESSVVNTRDATSDSIDGGAIRGQNLFHSFEEFNVGEDRGVYFSNPDDVTNIFSRVTGNDVSNILGTLGVDGAANLFLINPNGIVFGEGASLDVNGSFAATTADGIEFGEQGFFSAINPESPPLLTINPSAYLFNQVEPGAIANNSQASADFNPATSFDDDFFGLRVPDGESLLFLGGDVKADGGGLVASGGRIDLGAVAAEGVVGLNANGSLNIPDGISRGDVSLTNGAGFLVAGDGGGDIAIAAKNISLDSASGISAGVYGNVGSPDTKAGDIIINATDNVTVDNSRVANEVYLETVGDAGNIFIDANSLQILNGSQIGSPTYGQGDGGNVTVRASNIELAGASSDGQLTSGLFTTVVGSQAQGNGGNLTINTDNLSLSDRAQVSASTAGKGNSGNIDLIVDNSISLNNSTIANNVASNDAVGNAGKINITTGSLFATNVSQINSFTLGQGDAGDITIQAGDTVTFDGFDNDNNYSGASTSVEAGGEGDGGNITITARSLALTNGGELDVSLSNALDTLPGGKGQGGSIELDIDDILTIAGENARGIFASLDTGAEGSSGDIDIKTGNLVVQDGGLITSSASGRGDAGDITIRATDAVTFDGFASRSASSVGAGGEGDGGDINITARSLSLTNGGQLDTSVREAFETFSAGKGQGGNININVNDTLTIANGNRPGIFADLEVGTMGNGGDIQIKAKDLLIQNGGEINSSSSGQGDSGNIVIAADNSISLDASSYILNNVQDVNAEGNAGKIDITTGSLSATNGSQINSFTRGRGDAGDITIQATDAVTFDEIDNGNEFPSGTSSSVEAGGEGNGGNLKITTRSLSLTNGSYLKASVGEALDSLPGGNGQGGSISINVDDTLTIGGENVRGIYATLDTGAEGSSGDIDIKTGNLVVKDGGVITASTFGQGDSGNLSITAENSISLDASSYILNNVQDINAEGNAGKINITTGSLSATNGSQINSFTRGQGNAGDITIQAIDAITFDGFDSNNYSSAFSSVEAGANGNGGNINITARSLSLTNGGQLEASVFGETETLRGGKGQGGSININVDDTLTIAGQTTNGIFASLYAGAEGSGGNIDIQTGNLVVRDGGQINSFTRGQGDAGDITIQATDTITFAGFDSNELPSSLNTTVNDGAVGDGGDINLTAGDIRLRDNSDIRTNVFNGTGDGGNINITADSVIAFDDSDILASAPEGKGGNINLNTSAFFAENFTRNSLTANPATLDNNSRADVNATGAVSGSVTIPDVSFIQNSLNNLPKNSINTDKLLANSCVVPVGDRKKGKFFITGTESFPLRPGDALPSKYPTGEVRNVPEKNSNWQPGDPIVEPQGAYRLANGKLVLSRECSQ